LVTAIALFTLSTVQAVINLVLGAADIDDIDIPYDQLVDATTIIYGVNKYVPSLPTRSIHLLYQSALSLTAWL
jgi:hypothetical protein